MSFSRPQHLSSRHSVQQSITQVCYTSNHRCIQPTHPFTGPSANQASIYLPIIHPSIRSSSIHQPSIHQSSINHLSIHHTKVYRENLNSELRDTGVGPLLPRVVTLCHWCMSKNITSITSSWPLSLWLNFQNDTMRQRNSDPCRVPIQHHLLVNLKSFSYNSVGEDTDIFFSLFDLREGKTIRWIQRTKCNEVKFINNFTVRGQGWKWSLAITQP